MRVVTEEGEFPPQGLVEPHREVDYGPEYHWDNEASWEFR